MKEHPDSVPVPVLGKRAPLSATVIWVFFICTFLGALAIAYFLYSGYKMRLQQTRELLLNMGNEKLGVIDLWLNERKRDTETMAGFPVIQDLVSHSKVTQPVAHAERILDTFGDHFDYSAVYVIDTHGNVVVSTTHAPAFPKDRLWFGETVRSVRFETLIPDDQIAPKAPPIAILTPIWSPEGASDPAGTLVCITKASSLASVVESSPVTTGVRSFFLSRTRGGRTVYLTPLRLWPPPQDWYDRAALPALNGEQAFLTRNATDGTPEYCVTGTVPVLGWGMITRIERHTVDRPFFINVLLTAGLFIVVIVMILSIAIAMWRHQQIHALRMEIQRRLETEERLRQSEERWEKAFRSSPEAIAISSMKDERFIEVNDNFLKLHGYKSRDEVVGKTAKEMNLWMNPEDRKRMLEEVRSEGTVTGKISRVRTSDGRTLDIEMSAESMQLQGEECVMVLGRDVTAHLQLEEQYRQAQKMEAVGRLAGGIAHDFNNMLAVISLSCELMLEEEGAESPVGRRLAVIRNATERAAGLTRQLLAFSRQQVLQPQITDVNAIVTDTKKMLERVIGEDVAIHLDLWPKPCPIMADAGQLVQILMNLAVNSRDAMPEGGKLTLRTRVAMLPNTIVHEGYEDKLHVELSVSDTGVGIDPAVQQRIFEPFFTTKRDGKGTGLGLATVYGIVKQSNGCIQLVSEPGRGTTFHIYFPVAEGKSRATGEKHEAERHVGQGRILLVEDEFEIRELARQTLTTAGYEVETAVDGVDALEKFLGGQSYDLLITDLTMPRMNGRVLVSTLRERGLSPDVVYISAYSDAVLSSDDGVSPDLLQKPFSRQDLLGRVRSVLRGMPRPISSPAKAQQSGSSTI